MIDLIPNEIKNMENTEYYEPINTSLTPSTGYLISKYQVSAPQETEYYEPMRTTLAEPGDKKERIGIWQSIFGEKKCRRCSQKKRNCICSIRKKRKDKSVQSDIDVKTVCTDMTQPYGTGQDVKNSGSCPVKCTPPSAQRGFGVHLYFCVDSKRKNEELKNKKSLNFNNTNVGIYTGLNSFNNSLDNNTLHKETPKVEIVKYVSKIKINDPHNDVKNKSTYTTNENNKDQTSKHSPAAKLKRTDHAVANHSNTKNPFQYPYSAPEQSDVYQVPNMKETTFSSYEPVVSSQNKSYDDNNLNDTQKPNILFDYSQKDETWNIEKEDKLLKEGLTVDRPSILRKTSKHVNYAKTTVLPLQDTSCTFSFQGEPPAGRNKEDNFIPDSSNKHSSGTGRQNGKSLSKTGLFVRNSLVSMRKDRRQSILENRVSLILEKLINIEDKIGELEKITEDKSNDITISCNNNKSTVAFAFNKQQVGNTVIPVNSPTVKKKSILKIKSQNEKIYLNGTREVAVIKQKRKVITNIPKTATCHNPYELDAHAIASKSYSNPKSFQCNNPKIVIECSKKNKSLKSPVFCHKWEKISEELKISRPDVTVKR